MPQTFGRRMANISSIDGSDYVLVHEVSTGQIKKILASTVMSGGISLDDLIGALPVSSAMATTDSLVFYDAAASASKTITLEDFSALIGTGEEKPRILESAINITEDYTITTGYNGLSVGPVAVAEGITVTIPEGSTWKVI